MKKLPEYLLGNPPGFTNTVNKIVFLQKSTYTLDKYNHRLYYTCTELYIRRWHGRKISVVVKGNPALKDGTLS
jgi:hypothetical protein